ncbi:MAG: hypothetical protein KAX28_11165 [Candidatus Marinimicrobia bacterium]|nr:hypothetical protein [Candidatus Neomarinimicrobiota bacterium]
MKASGQSGQKRVQIIFNSRSVRKSRFVNPGRLCVKSGEEVIFEAKNTTTTIWIPNAEELFENGEKHLIFDIENGDKSKTFKVEKDLERGKEYPYAVYCENSDDFAEGNTSPRMIIE